MTGLYDNDEECIRHRSAIRALAHESGAPENDVARIYEQELARLKRRALVKDFLPVLVGRKVRTVLRRGP